MDGRTTSITRITFLGLLGIVFITLKLTGYIDWSWWWVTLPIWGGAALVILTGLVFLVLFLLLDGNE